MLIANQNLLQKHVRSFIYAINLKEMGYVGLFFLTEKIYDKICLRKDLILENLIFKHFSIFQKAERSPKLRFTAHNKYIEVILFGFFYLPSVTIEFLSLEVMH